MNDKWNNTLRDLERTHLSCASEHGEAALSRHIRRMLGDLIPATIAGEVTQAVSNKISARAGKLANQIKERRTLRRRGWL